MKLIISKKKFLSVTLILVLIFSLLGCNDNGGKQENSTSKKETSVSVKNTVPEKSSVTTATVTESTTPREKKALSGFKILLDAGHGCTKTYTEPVAPGSSETRVESPSTGTSGVVTKKSEGDLTLEIALLLEKSLKNYGADVYMIRRTSGTPMSLVDRANYGNKLNVDLAFRIHADGVDDSSANGASVLYPSDDYVSKKVSEKSANAAECVIRKYAEATGLYNRGTVERSDLTGFNFTKVPCILIEMGFMTNPDDDKKMSDSSFQKKMIQGMVRGIIDYKNRK